MKKRLNQYISLGVMLLLIALVISLLPEYPPIQGAHNPNAATNVAARTVDAESAPARRN